MATAVAGAIPEGGGKMAFLQELTDNKLKLMQLFLSDPTLVKLLTNEENPVIPAMDLRYKQVYPYHWLSDAIIEQKSFLCFSVLVPNVVSSVIKDVDIIIHIFSHDKLMRTPNGVRIDLIAAAVDNLLNGITNFGFGKVELKGMRTISPAKDHYGYEIKYRVQDFNRLCSRI